MLLDVQLDTPAMLSHYASEESPWLTKNARIIKLVNRNVARCESKNHHAVCTCPEGLHHIISKNVRKFKPILNDIF